MRGALGPGLAFFALSLVLSLLTPAFLNPDNLSNVLVQSAINAVLAAGMTFVILTGGIDLAVGSTLALSGMILGHFLKVASLPVAIVACLGVGALLGLLNGLMITRGKLPPFIATLGMMSAARGLALVYSGGRPETGFPNEFVSLGGGLVLVGIMVCVYGLSWLLLQRTVFGRSLYALGGNEQAAWLSGLPTDSIKTRVYVLSGLLSGVAAIMLTARLNSAQPIAGVMYELDAIAAVVMGGTSLSGGQGGVVGTLFGALIMGVLRNGLNLLDVSADMQQVVIGIVIVLAVLVDRSRDQLGASFKTLVARRPLGTALGAAALALLVLVGAASYRASHSRGGQITVAFVLKTKNNPFWVDMEQAAQKAAQEAGVNLIVQAPERETDVEKQMQIVENLIQKRVSVIVLAPCGSKEIVQAIAKANQAGIPVLTVDTRVDMPTLQAAGAHVETFIGSDNLRGGELAGEFLCQALGDRGRVIVLEGIAGHETVDARKRGFLKALESHKGVSVAASQTANAEQEKAFNVCQNLLQADPNIQGLFAANDVMALGALSACKAMGRNDIKIVGFDASGPGREAIKAGTMLGSVAQYPGEMGRLGVEKSLECLRGVKLPDYVPTKVDVIDKSKI